ncbi:hypothetical protein RT09_22250 [Salmonella enterica subsp. enterica]|nr:hypothetical protein [Salmonella enterica]ECE0061093.1 hypothetical protein [Salmonella enterica subsp. enterica]EDA0354526.1 hypothetical protein [Salmonella enterica subsp. enterica serovar Kentucky]EDB5178816.1 hypothetical protein [Salmonella enterica subsp. enterica serovar Enteritidis]EDG9619146.1 hypothetical protein [Salmonella enterica subsp. enterica serovar Schwarzengrund]EDS3534803.1 hypothetical protein [Salmonella enterica subsp. enterica serovar Infantis]EEK9978048.1 hypothe
MTKFDVEIVVSVTVTQSIVYVTPRAVTGRGKIQVSGLEPQHGVYGEAHPYHQCDDCGGHPPSHRFV